MKTHQVRVCKRPDAEGPLAGHNAQIFIDGMEIKAVTKVAFDLAAGDIALFKLEMYVDDLEIGDTETATFEGEPRVE